MVGEHFRPADMALHGILTTLGAFGDCKSNGLRGVSANSTRLTQACPTLPLSQIWTWRRVLHWLTRGEYGVYSYPNFLMRPLAVLSLAAEASTSWLN